MALIGVPHTVISDNASPHISESMRELLRRIDCTHSFWHHFTLGAMPSHVISSDLNCEVDTISLCLRWLLKACSVTPVNNCWQSRGTGFIVGVIWWSMGRGTSILPSIGVRGQSPSEIWRSIRAFGQLSRGYYQLIPERIRERGTQ